MENGLADLFQKEVGNFWDEDHPLEPIRIEVSKLIPDHGPVLDEESPKLEKLRVLTNAYWDLFNNGGGNASRKVSYYFPGAITAFHGGKNHQMDGAASKKATFAITEPIMAKAVFAAALEQGFLG